MNNLKFNKLMGMEQAKWLINDLKVNLLLSVFLLVSLNYKFFEY